jgi:hypothetical protein
MTVERNHSRIAPRDFQGFDVQVTLGDRYFTGELGNISEEGLCVLLPGTVRASDFDSVRGAIQARHLGVAFDFNGKVAWTSDAVHAGRPCTLVGVDFEQELELPPAVIALGMAVMQADL